LINVFLAAPHLRFFAFWCAARPDLPLWGGGWMAGLMRELPGKTEWGRAEIGGGRL